MSWSLQYLPISIIVYLRFFLTSTQTLPLFTTCLQYFLFIYLGMQLLKKYPAFHDTARLIAENGHIGKSTPLVPPLTQMNPFRYVFQLRSMWILFSHLYRTNVFQEYQTHADIDQAAYTDAWKNTIKLHVQVFLRKDIWFFETCQRQYNGIKSFMKKKSVHFVGSFYMCITMHISKNVKSSERSLSFRLRIQLGKQYNL